MLAIQVHAATPSRGLKHQLRLEVHHVLDDEFQAPRPKPHQPGSFSSRRTVL